MKKGMVHGGQMTDDAKCRIRTAAAAIRSIEYIVSGTHCAPACFGTRGVNRLTTFLYCSSLAETVHSNFLKTGVFLPRYWMTATTNGKDALSRVESTVQYGAAPGNFQKRAVRCDISAAVTVEWSS